VKLDHRLARVRAMPDIQKKSAIGNLSPTTVIRRRE
jgi:hypothetical protein